jgi:hypothetical protein
LNEAQLPNCCVVRVAPGTGYTIVPEELGGRGETAAWLISDTRNPLVRPIRPISNQCRHGVIDPPWLFTQVPTDEALSTWQQWTQQGVAHGTYQSVGDSCMLGSRVLHGDSSVPAPAPYDAARDYNHDHLDRGASLASSHPSWRLSLITRSFNGNTVRNFPTHGQNCPQPKETLPAVSTLTLPY